MKFLATIPSSFTTRVEVDLQKHNVCHIGFVFDFNLADAGVRATDQTPIEKFDAACEKLNSQLTLDEALSKEFAEFLALGACYNKTVGQQPVSAMIRVGGITKRVAVYGDRSIDAFGRVESPQPFTEMPITPEKAFGGEGYPSNPLGVGAHCKDLDPSEPRVLPNIEMPNQLLEAGFESPDPAGFWPWPQDHPVRLGMLGKFNEDWLANRWPHAPSDTQSAYYNQAPLDQRITGYWQGGEPIEIVNMHPEHSHIQSAIPRVRPRIFVVREALGQESFVELKTVMDTLWLLPEQLTGIMIARASVQCKDLDGDDIKAVYADIEVQGEAPKSLDEQYETYLLAAGIKLPEESEEPDSDLEGEEEPDVVNDAETFLQDLPEADLTADPTDDAAVAAMAEDQAAYAKVDAWADGVLQKTDMTKANEMIEDAMNKALPQDADNPEALKALLRESRTGIADALKASGLSEDDVLKAMASNPEMAPFVEMMQGAPGGLQGMLADLEANIDELFALNKQLEELENAPPEAEQEEDEFEEEEVVEPTLTREWVVEHHAQGGSFAEMDLSELDLSNLVLKGAVFTGAVVTGCNFQRTDLSNARFEQASVVACDFSESQLKFANFYGASVSESTFGSANLGFANLSGADMSGCRLPAAQLEKANATGATFNDSDLQGVQAPGLVADQAQFHDANLMKADFQQSRFTRAVFFNANIAETNFRAIYAPRADFCSATAVRSDFSEAFLNDTEADESTDFSGASFVGANLEGVSWAGPKLDSANLDDASLDNADMTGASMKGARMIRAVAKGATLDKVTLHDADLSGLNLFEGRLRGADISNSRLEMGNYFGVDFQDATLDRVSFEGSDIGRTILAVRKALGK